MQEGLGKTSLTFENKLALNYNDELESFVGNIRLESVLRSVVGNCAHNNNNNIYKVSRNFTLLTYERNVIGRGVIGSI